MSAVFPFRFEMRYNEDVISSSHNWEQDSSIDEVLPKIIDNINSCIDDSEKDGMYYFFTDDLYVKHWLYCCSCTPFDKVCFDVDDFKRIIELCKAGDILQIWSLSETDPKYFCIKCPNHEGLFPTKGAY